MASKRLLALMVAKRFLEIQQSKRRNMFKRRNVFDRRNFAHKWDSNALLDAVRRIAMEPLIRKMVREEIERGPTGVQPRINTFPRFPLDQVETFQGGGFLLHFVNNLPSCIFTFSRIEAEDRNPVQIELLDAATKAIVSSGPLSSQRIQIVVLDGDFGSEKEEWTEKEFNDNVIHERDGKGPLVTGELSITLKNGVGHIGNVTFTDNSCWTRSRNFRLGVKISQKTPSEVRIREGRSSPFVVKDRRGKPYKKHHPPYLHDEVWRLEKIRKDGVFHKRLASHGVQTINDFLRMHESDPSGLQNIIGNKITSTTWEKIVEHATKCVPDEGKFYTYTGAAQSVRLRFNSMYKVVEAAFDGKTYIPTENLDSLQKLLVDNLKRQAYRNMKDLVLVDADSTISPSLALANAPSEISQTSIFQSREFSITHQDEAARQLPKETYLAQNNLPMEVFDPPIMNGFMNDTLFLVPFNGENNCPPSASQGELAKCSSQLSAKDIPGSLCNDSESDSLSFLDTTDVHMTSSTSMSLADLQPKISQTSIFQTLEFLTAHQDEAVRQLPKETYLAQNNLPMEVLNPLIMNGFMNDSLFSIPFNGENNCPPSASQGELAKCSSQLSAKDIPGSLCDDSESDSLSFLDATDVHMTSSTSTALPDLQPEISQTSSLPPLEFSAAHQGISNDSLRNCFTENLPPSPWRQGSSICFPTENDEESYFLSSFPGSFDVHMTSFRRQKAQWCKIRAALRLYSVRRVLLRRNLAARPLFGGLPLVA